MAQLAATPFDVSTRAQRLRCQPGFPKVPARFMGTRCGIEHLDTYIESYGYYASYDGRDLAYDATNVNKFALQLRDLKNNSKIIWVERNITFDELRRKLPKSESKLRHKYIENPCHFFIKMPSGVYEEPNYAEVIDANLFNAEDRNGLSILIDGRPRKDFFLREENVDHLEPYSKDDAAAQERNKVNLFGCRNPLLQNLKVYIKCNPEERVLHRLLDAGVTCPKDLADRQDKIYFQNSDGSFEWIATIEEVDEEDRLYPLPWLKLKFVDKRIHHFTPGDKVFIGDERFMFSIFQVTPYPLFKTVETRKGRVGNYRYIDLGVQHFPPSGNYLTPIKIPHLDRFDRPFAAETSLWQYLKIYRVEGTDSWTYTEGQEELYVVKKVKKDDLYVFNPSKPVYNEDRVVEVTMNAYVDAAIHEEKKSAQPHPFVDCIHCCEETVVDHDFVYQFTPMAQYGDMVDRSQRLNRASWGSAQARHVIDDMTYGLQGLHEMGLAYFDGSLENTLVSKDTISGRDRYKLWDYGMAGYMLLDEDGKRVECPSRPAGKVHYRYPFARRGSHDGIAADMWALGMTWATFFFVFYFFDPQQNSPDNKRIGEGDHRGGLNITLHDKILARTEESRTKYNCFADGAQWTLFADLIGRLAVHSPARLVTSLVHEHPLFLPDGDRLLDMYKNMMKDLDSLLRLDRATACHEFQQRRSVFMLSVDEYQRQGGQVRNFRAFCDDILFSPEERSNYTVNVDVSMMSNFENE